MVRIAEGVTGFNILHADDGHDIAGLGAGNLVAVVGMHLNHAADALGFAGCRIENGGTLLDNAGVDANEGQGAKAVIHDLEGQGTERLAFRHQGYLSGGSAFGISQRLWVHFGGVGQIIDNGVEDQLHTFVLEG